MPDLATGSLPEPAVTPADLRDRRIELGRALAARRKAARLTQQELAWRVVCSRSGIANIETGRQTASVGFWRAVDRELGADGLLLKASAQLADLSRAFAMQLARERAAASAATRCTACDRCACAVVVPWWTGRETHALRQALRMGLPEFARAVNVSTTTAVAWERPPSPPARLVAQSALDRVLARSTPDARGRFRLLLGDPDSHD